MSGWRYTLRIKHIWENDEMSVEEKGRAIAAVIRQTFPDEWFDFDSADYDEDIDMIADGFDSITGYDDTSPVEEFDEFMYELYEWADRGKMCWVQTSF